MASSKAKAAAKTTKKTTVVTEESGDGGEIVIGDGAEETAPTDVIGELLGLESDGLTYKVYMMPSKPGDKLTYCSAYTKETLSLDSIRDTFGGGTYRIIAYNAKNQFESQKSITLFGFAKPASAPAAGGSNDTMNMLLKMFEAQSAMLTAVLSKPSTPAPAGPSFTELVTLIKTLEPKDRTDSVDMLLKGLTLGRELGGDGGGGTDLMGLAGKGLDALKPLIAAQAMNQPAPKAPAPARLPASVPPAEIAPPPKTREEIEQMMLMKKLTWLQHITADLVQRAARGKDPELYAEVFLDNIPPFITEEEIAARFSDESAIAQLAQVNPAVAEHAAWFESFRQSVIELLVGDDEPPREPPANGAGHDIVVP